MKTNLLHIYFMIKQKKIVGISEPLYKYVIRENSIMTKKYSVKNLAYVEAVNNRIEYCMEHGLEEVGQGVLTVDVALSYECI